VSPWLLDAAAGVDPSADIDAHCSGSIRLIVQHAWGDANLSGLLARDELDDQRRNSLARENPDLAIESRIPDMTDEYHRSLLHRSACNSQVRRCRAVSTDAGQVRPHPDLIDLVFDCP
jgi:hypothetical protein